MRKNNQKGFTLIELLVIVFIVAILASVILVSVHLASVKAGDNSAFTSLKSSASAAYMCLLNGVPGVTLSTPRDDDLKVICTSGGSPINGYSAWPGIAKNHWTYGDGTPGADGFFWCKIGAIPPVSCAGPVDGICGQSSTGGTFCYGLKNGSREIWCNQDGCHKVGF